MEKQQLLAKYMPPEAAPIIARWIDYFQCEFKISKTRATKLGDYRHPFKGAGHKISVNNNLNIYAFLVTTVHEFAHLLTWNDHKNKVKPHGEEWKRNFKRMMAPFIDQQIFPQDLQLAIVAYLNNPSAASCTDLNLSRALKKYNEQQETTATRLEELPLGSVFSTKDGRKFKKGDRLRKRYSCLCLQSGRIYLFNPLAEVTMVSTEGAQQNSWPLAAYNNQLQTAGTRLEELPLDSVFSIKDGRQFKKGERLRKRYRCLCLDNGDMYLFSPLAEVTLMSKGS